MNDSVTDLCEELDDVRAAVRRKVWGEQRGNVSAADGRGSPDGAGDGESQSDAALRRLRAREQGLRAVRELRTRSRAHVRVSRHPSVSPLVAAAAYDAGLGVKPRYDHGQVIPYPREMLDDPGTLTRARKKRAAARRAKSARASRKVQWEQLGADSGIELQSIELVISCAELEGVPSMQARQPKGAKLAVCVQARLLLWRGECWELYGSTEPVRHGTNPAFAKSFLLGVSRELLEAPDEPQLPRTKTGPFSWEAGGMKCRVELHYRWGARATDATQSAAGEALIGYVEFPTRQLMNTPGQCLATSLEPSGRLAVRGILVRAGLHQQATVRLRASFNAAGQPATSASYFFVIARELGTSASALSSYELIGRSENIVNRRTKSLGCRDFSLSTHKLCYGDFETKLKVSVFQFDPFGQHTLVGDGTFRPAEALHFPAPLGSPSSHLRVQTMSALDVSCVSKSSVDSSATRLGSRPNSPVSDQNSEVSQGSWGGHHEEDQGSDNETDRSSTADLSEPEPSDPFSMLHCPLYSPPSSSGSADRTIIGALRVSLGLSETSEIPVALRPSRASSRTSGTVTEKKDRFRKGPPDRVPMLHESLDGDYMRAVMSDDTLMRKSDQELHAEEALCHLAERRSAVSRLAELQRQQRSTAFQLQKSLDLRTVVRQQLRPNVARMVTESAEERDARLFAVLCRGTEREHRLRSEEQEAEELGEIETFLSQPQRRRKQEAQTQHELAERARAMRQSSETHCEYSFDGKPKDENSRCFQPTEAVEEALEQVVQRRPLRNSPNDEHATVGISWKSSRRNTLSMSFMRETEISQRSTRVGDDAEQRPNAGSEAECDPGGFLRASLLFTEALNTQIDPRTAHLKNVAQPNLLQISGRQSMQPKSAMHGGADTVHSIFTPTQRTRSSTGNGLVQA